MNLVLVKTWKDLALAVLLSHPLTMTVLTSWLHPPALHFLLSGEDIHFCFSLLSLPVLEHKITVFLTFPGAGHILYLMLDWGSLVLALNQQSM